MNDKPSLVPAALRMVLVTVLGAAALLQAPVQAQALSDPTRPPASLAPVQGDAQPVSSLPVLQSVMIGPRRAQAIISGQTVKVGDRIGDARVTKISETEVVLRSGNNTQTLRLYPGLEKRPAAGRGMSRPGRQGE